MTQTKKMAVEQYIPDTAKAAIFELDDVIYPKRDYLLQVYYLFAQFLEYTEAHPPASELVDFLKKSYEHHGEEGLFAKAMAVFGIPSHYEENFDRLHRQAQLPVELLLYPEVEQLMQGLRDAGTPIVVYTPGEPLMQLNKLKHIKWNGLDRVLRAYFRDELVQRGQEPMAYLLGQLGIADTQTVYVGKNGAPEGYAGHHLPISTLLGATKEQ